VSSFEDVILVNQMGQRFWNELDDSYKFLSACLGTNGNLGRGSRLAAKIVNPYQSQPIAPRVLEETVARYNSHVELGKDLDFSRPSPQFKIETPLFYAAWSTPILHDTLTGLRINTKCQVMDVRGRVISGLYCAGETAGGFGLHGLPRATVFGRIAGREAARV
jgi:succinate dehydrogenase/fumarate reductase flavoprotein subunit